MHIKINKHLNCVALLTVILFIFVAGCQSISSSNEKESLNFDNLSKQEIKELKLAINETKPEQFKDRSGNILKYRIYEPKTVEDKQYPLIIFLHGSGERGNDNISQLKWSVGSIIQYILTKNTPAFVLIPQCPKKQRWADYIADKDGKITKMITLQKNPTEPLKLSMELLTNIESKYPVNKNRIYIIGISMGAFGTWDWLMRKPDLFAAAIPISGGGDSNNYKKLKLIAHIPIWAFHGAKDDVVPEYQTAKMLEGLKKEGGHPKSTIYKNLKHVCWNRALSNPEVLTWLFEQKQ